MKSRGSSQSGVGLIELMISITIGLVILAAILAVFTATSSTSKQSESTTRMSEDAAVAMNYMAGYVRMAGFSFPQVNVSGSVTDSNFSGSGVRGCDNGFSNPTVSSTAALTCNSGTGNSSIAIRFQGDLNNTTPSSGNPTDCLNQAVTASTASAYPGAPSYSLIESRFFVATGTNSGVAELYCAGNGSSSFVAQPIMQYVERLVLTYGIAEDAASQKVVQYVNAATIDALAGDVDQRWSRVISVRMCFLMRSEQPTQTGRSTPYRDCSGASVTPTDGFVRRTFQTVVTLRNRGGVSS
jgi:type IV pilus assembly protein PilW